MDTKTIKSYYETPDLIQIIIRIERNILIVSGPGGNGEIEPIGYETE
ncbi:MAG: hypothetical protein IKX67_06375 [Bacteroidales bacterium]|nr:hypothetical protein [Bacteroidales bacterium]